MPINTGVVFDQLRSALGEAEARIADVAKAEGRHCNAVRAERLQAQFAHAGQRIRGFEGKLAQGVWHAANATHQGWRRSNWALIAALGALILGMVLARRAS
jgi:hypothetical protein